MGKMTDGAGVQYIWARMEQYLQKKLEAVPRILPFPLLRVTYNVKAQTAHIDTYSNFTGYPDGITVRYKQGSEPTESDAVVDISAGVTVSTNARYYFRAFAPDGSGWQDSPYNSITVSIPALKTLPTPSISVSRLSSSQGRVSISNYSSYPSGTKLVINGSSYAMASSVTLSIGTSSTSVSVYAAYDGTEYYESQSATASATIPAYVAPKCATPSISFSSSSNRVSITCSTSGATIYYSRGGGSYSVYSGSFTISSSTTIYAYATAPGYSTSSTASRYCSYTAPTPSLPTPQLSMSGMTMTSNGDTRTFTVNFRVSNASSFPSATRFSGTLRNNSRGWSISLGYAGNPSDVSNWAHLSNYTSNSATDLDSFTFTLTATCSGYNSSSASASVRAN